MATVFMKWLERSPQDYDRGIRILTLGALEKLHHEIVHRYIQADMRVLEIGCGSGALAVEMARQGAVVVGIDASAGMLAQAKKRIEKESLSGSVDLRLMDASMLAETFDPASFDCIVASLVLSEMPLDDQTFLLQNCSKLLKTEGRLLIADEVLPDRGWDRLRYHAVHLPLTLLTWLLTRTTTSPLCDFSFRLESAGFDASLAASYLAGSLVLYDAQPVSAISPESVTAGREAVSLPAPIVGRLRHQVTLRTLLIDLWALFFRIIPPYPKVRPGLYRLGNPSMNSPVLVTGNFDLTVRRLVKAIDELVDAWILVVDTSGINVWCAAGGGFFTAEKVTAALKSSRVETVVNHHALILPQLCANGVDGWRIREQTGWGVHWGPARATDIPAYLAGHRKKSDAMRWVRFPLKDRLEMVTVTLGFYGLLILLPVFIFWRSLFWPVAASMLCLSYFYAVVHPWLPGRDGLAKSVPLALITLAGFFIYSSVWNPLPPVQLFHWAIGLTGLSVFTAAELQGMSPLMRGEQANWSWEALIGAGLALFYWLVPVITGWR
jgi:ubiquinone/menaquinone biosynthesis C-methylase UbiE